MVVYFLSLLFVSSFPPFLEKKIVCGVCLVCGVWIGGCIRREYQKKGEKKILTSNLNFLLVLFGLC
jgi:hypothetical protein